MEHRFRDIGEDKLTEKGYLETHGLRKATETTETTGNCSDQVLQQQ